MRESRWGDRVSPGRDWELRAGRPPKGMVTGVRPDPARGQVSPFQRAGLAGERPFVLG
jgi:hypothetical protein